MTYFTLHNNGSVKNNRFLWIGEAVYTNIIFRVKEVIVGKHKYKKKATLVGLPFHYTAICNGAWSFAIVAPPILR